MTEKVIANVSIIEEGPEFFYSLDDGESRVGPFDDEEAATMAATTFLQETYASFLSEALFGDSK